LKNPLSRGKRRVASARDPAAEKSPAKTKGGTKGKGKGGEERHSRRTHIVLNTPETASRFKATVQRRSTLPKETVLVQKTYTQPELLARAPDAEGTIFEGRNTSPRRRRSGGVRASSGTASRGPKPGWICRVEELRPSSLPPLPPVTAQHPPGVLMLSPASATSYGHYPVSSAPDYPWANPKVYGRKARPLSRPIQTCPVTGPPAPYLDPQTGVPFVNVRAYDVLAQILNHEYAWSAGLGCYIA
ncbi:hypothetical protein FIBSPDRAFT_967991, partial [Athelia psychrophila]